MQFPRVLAHRGASKQAPENTLSAFKAAKRLGAAWVEFDVQPSLDGELVVFHDDTLDRASNGTGKLSAKKFDDLKKLDLGGWFDPQFVNERILLLSDLLIQLKDLALNFNLELKPSVGDDQRVIKGVLDLLRQHHCTSESFFLSSFNPSTLSAIRRLDADVPIALLLNDWDERCVDVAKTLNAVAINLPVKAVTKDRVTQIKSCGYHLLVFTVNDKVQAEQFFEWGVDGVFTDDVTIYGEVSVD